MNNTVGRLLGRLLRRLLRGPLRFLLCKVFFYVIAYFGADATLQGYFMYRVLRCRCYFLLWLNQLCFLALPDVLIENHVDSERVLGKEAGILLELISRSRRRGIHYQLRCLIPTALSYSYFTDFYRFLPIFRTFLPVYYQVCYSPVSLPSVLFTS